MIVKLDSSLFPAPITVYDSANREASKFATTLLKPTITVEENGVVIYKTGETTDRVLFYVVVIGIIISSIYLLRRIVS